MFYDSFSVKKSILKEKQGRSKGRLKAAMTIYFMLVMLIIMALICTLIESGRVSAINARLRSITYMSADSVFAEFAQPVFDRYGVMMLWMDEEELTEKFSSYVKKNLDLSETGAGMDLDLYGMKYLGGELKNADWITDQNARPFSEQVHEYMKVHAVEGIAETLLSNTDLFEQSEKARKILGEVSQFQDEFVEVEETVGDIYQKTQKVKDLSENPKTLLEEISRTLEGYEGNENADAAFSEQKQALQRSTNEISQELSGIQEKSEEYRQKTEATENAVEEMREKFAVNEKDMDPQIYQAISNTLDELEGSGGAGGTKEDISETIAAAEEYQTLLNGLDQYYSETGEMLSEENISSYRQLTRQYETAIDSFDLSRLESGMEKPEGGIASSGFIRKVNQKYQTGLLDLLAGEISEKAVNRETFPSVTLKKDSSTDDSEGFVDKTARKALFCEYIREHFQHFGKTEGDHPLDYEAEYILAGKDSDRDNLSVAITDMVLLRFGANLVSIMMDANKKAEIQGLAMAIIGFTGQMYLVKIAELVLTLVWALAESMIDVRQLLHDKRVPIIKKAEEWYFSIEGLQNFTGDEEGGEGFEDGLNYEEYLMTLLMLENRDHQVFRTMDVIQANMCEEETDRFRIKDCMTGIQMEASFSAPSVFSVLPVVRRSFEAGTGGYQFQFIQDYTY